MIYYTGIGSRETPEDICRKMFTASRAMARLGFTLRSGGAQGADHSFESGCAAENGNSEIYLPWKGFRKNPSKLFGTCKPARVMASKYHPNWANVSCAGRDFHARNVYQILGKNLQTPSSFVLCWTPNGAITGGTGQALRIAQDYEIPILNFATDDEQFISDFILKQAERK